MRRLDALKTQMLATPDQQISLTDPCADSKGKPPLKSARSIILQSVRCNMVAYSKAT